MNIIITTIIKDEHLNLEEWIKYNLSIGFTHIYLFEDIGSRSHKEICDNYDRVTLYKFDELPMNTQRYTRGSIHQMAMYEYVLTNMRDTADWCAFIDPDEYIMLEEGYTLERVLAECGSNEALYLYWKTIGASGNISRPKENIINAYAKKGYLLGEDRSYQGKSVVNLKTTTQDVFDIHFHPNGVNTLGLKTERIACYHKAWINHYFTKSWEDWYYQIMRRGDVSKGHRTLEHFFEVNPDISKEDCYRFTFVKDGLSGSFVADDVVSVCMVTKNRKSLVEKAIWSVLGQTYKNIEFIIVDDNSTDGTWELLEYYASIDNRIIIYHETKGFISARNRAYSLASGSYIANMDDDDIRDIDSVEKQYKYIVANNIDGCGTLLHKDVGEWDNQPDETTEAIIERYKQQLNCSLVGGTMMFERSVLSHFEKGKYFLDCFADGGEDSAFIIQALNAGCKFQKIQEKLYWYIYRNDNTRNHWQHKVISSLMSVCKHDGDKYFKLIGSLYKRKQAPIPKTIHYCWFGGAEKPELVKRCIASWKQLMPEYKLVEWNESNYDVNAHAFTQDAYNKGKYAFVSDYVRMDVLNKYGGVYLDTDVELLKSIDPLVSKGEFLCSEKDKDGNVVGIALGLGIAMMSNNFLAQWILCACEEGLINENNISNYAVSELLQNFGYTKEGIEDVAGYTIYPPEYMCPKGWNGEELSIASNTYAIHHYLASWIIR